MVKASGKLMLLDKLLPKLKADNHRVLIFSQFRIMLNIIEDYLNLRNFTYERIDGEITGKKRQSAMDRYTISMNVYTLIYRYIYVYIYMYIYICIYMYICICMYIYVYIYMYYPRHHYHQVSNKRRGGFCDVIINPGWGGRY
jgi:hypothetical protein